MPRTSHSDAFTFPCYHRIIVILFVSPCMQLLYIRKLSYWSKKRSPFRVVAQKKASIYYQAIEILWTLHSVKRMISNMSRVVVSNATL